MLASRKIRTAVVLLLLTAVTACSRRHESNDFLPSSPEFQKALTIALAALSIPADGASTVRIEAQISPDADRDKRTVRFQTTLGTWVDPDAAPAAGGGAANTTNAGDGKTATREADGEGRAVAFLKSATETGVAVITVSVIDDQENVLATVSGEVTFTQVSEALTLTADPEESFADGASEVVLEAQITADSPATWKTVVFETTLGRYGGTKEAPTTTVEVTADSSRVARARLVSDDQGTATVNARIKEFPTATVTRFVTFGAPLKGELSVTPEGLDFGSVTVNETSDQGVTLGNHGTVPITVTALTVEPTGPFSISLFPALPATIAPADSVGLTVRFAPTSTGSKSASLEITSDAARPTVTVSLAGVAVASAPDIAVSPAALAFGDVDAASTKDLVLTISNTGTAILTVSAVSSNNGKFALMPAPPATFTVAPGGSRDVTVRYTPGAVGPEDSGTLSITSDDPQDPVKAVPMTGTGF